MYAVTRYRCVNASYIYAKYTLIEHSIHTLFTLVLISSENFHITHLFNYILSKQINLFLFIIMDYQLL